MQIVGLNNPIKNLAGEEIKDDGKPFLMSAAITNALLSAFPDEKDISGDEKVKRFLLATRLHGQDSIDLSADEVVLCKRLVAKAYNPLVVGQAWAVLEPRSGA
jgi:hypothetical protein